MKNKGSKKYIHMGSWYDENPKNKWFNKYIDNHMNKKSKSNKKEGK